MRVERIMRPQPAGAPEVQARRGLRDGCAYGATGRELPMSREPPGLTSRESLCAALLCAALAALLLAPVLFGGKSALSFDVGDPRIDVRPWAAPAAPGEDLPLINPITSDADFYVLPGLVRQRQAAEAGDAGLWEDRQLLGCPLRGNVPFPDFSPAAWLLSVLDPVSTLDWMLWLHLSVAAWLAYRVLRLLGAGPPAAACAAAGFALSGWMSTRWHLPHIVYTTAWWPGLLCTLGWWKRGAVWRGTAEGVFFLGVMLRSGHPQVGLTLLLAFLALLAVLRPLPLRRLFVPTALVGALGVMLALPPLVLLGETYAQSVRATPETRAITATQGMAPGALCALLLPEFFGRPSDFATDNAPAASMKEWLPQRLLLSDAASDNVVENALYPGVVLLLLLPLLWRRGMPREGRWLGALALLALATCLAWPWLQRAVPALSLVAAGSSRRLLVVWSAAAPLAGGFALQALIERRVRVTGAWVAAALCAAAVLAAPMIAARLQDPAAGDFAFLLEIQARRQVALLLAAGVGLWLATRGSRPLAFVPALLLALDLGALALQFNPFQVQREPFPSTPALAALAAREGRVAVLGGSNLLPPSAAATAGIESVHGVAGLLARRTAELLACIEGPLHDPSDPRLLRPFRQAASLGHPLLDLLAVTTVVHADPGLGAASGWTVLFENQAEGLGALARPHPGPRAFVCGGARVVTDDAQRLALLASREFPVHGTVLIERDIGLSLPEQGPMVPARILEGDAAGGQHGVRGVDGAEGADGVDGADGVVHARPGAVLVQADAPFDGVLVLANSWDPGWRVTVDGVDDRVLVADHALLGVAVKAGSHLVRFTYDPHGQKRARLAALAALVGLAALCMGAVRERRARDPAAPGIPQA